jgi:hypothetical protein
VRPGESNNLAPRPTRSTRRSGAARPRGGRRVLGHIGLGQPGPVPPAGSSVTNRRAISQFSGRDVLRVRGVTATNGNRASKGNSSEIRAGYDDLQASADRGSGTFTMNEDGTGSFDVLLEPADPTRPTFSTAGTYRC